MCKYTNAEVSLQVELDSAEATRYFDHDVESLFDR